MRPGGRKTAFVLAASDHGSLIVNRLDHCNQAFGVGLQILERSSYCREEADAIGALLERRRRFSGDGVVAIDCGANIGVYTVHWARHMHGWGSVIAIEAQERVFYALAGNIALNNCFNARAIWAAVGAHDGTMRIPTPDHLAPASFGSLELRPREAPEDIGQPIDYRDEALCDVQALTLDALITTRVDLIKVDVEGMELDVLYGASRLLAEQHPILVVEAFKGDRAELVRFLEQQGYRLRETRADLLAIHTTDRVWSSLHEIPAIVQQSRPVSQ